jgi:protein ImuB
LLERAYPAAEHLTTLMARLRALAGESRVNAPAVLDTHDARDVGMQAFAVTPPRAAASTTPAAVADTAAPCVAIRRFRLPVAARVMVERGSPVRVMPASSAIPAGRVIDRAGPWRTSGRWWTVGRANWDRDEWDVELSGGGCYRLVRDRANGNWAIEGEID